MKNKQWPKYRFQRAIPRLKDCLLDLGYCANEKEMEARKEFIDLCKQVVKETDTIGSQFFLGFEEGYQQTEGGL